MGRIDVMIEMEKNPPGNHTPKEIQLERSQCQSNEPLVTSIYSVHDLYFAAKEGRFEVFRNLLDQHVLIGQEQGGDDIFYKLSPNGNTVLHLAAKHGHHNIVGFIAEKIVNPDLIMLKNYNGDTALHLAARGGHEYVVDSLLQRTKNLSEADMKLLLGAMNERGNTALHEALINGWESIAKYLISKDVEVSDCRNMEGESALYLAANAGFAKCVSLIINKSSGDERICDLFKIKCPIQAAIMNKNRGGDYLYPNPFNFGLTRPSQWLIGSETSAILPKKYPTFTLRKYGSLPKKYKMFTRGSLLNPN